MDIKKAPNCQVILRKKTRAGGVRLLVFRQYYKATVTKTVWYWQKNRNIDQWNRIEGPEINLCSGGQLIYHKRAKNMQWRKTVSSITCVGKTGQIQVKE